MMPNGPVCHGNPKRQQGSPDGWQRHMHRAAIVGWLATCVGTVVARPVTMWAGDPSESLADQPASELETGSGETPELPDDSPLLERQFQGRSLRNWLAVLKNLDHTDPSAAAEVPGLIEIMQDGALPWFTRRQVALTLGRIGEPAADAVPLLIEHLGSEDVDTVNWAGKAIALFGPIGAPAAPALAGILRNETRPHSSRMTAIEALARIGASDPAVLPALIAALQSEGETADDQELRIAACDSLMMLKESAAPALPYLIRLSTSDSSRLRLSAVTSIGAMGSSALSAIDPLVDVVLFDAAPEVRDAAALSLGSIGESAVPALLVLAEDQEAEVRRLSAVALARAQASLEVRETLQTLATEDADEIVRVTAAESLRATGADPPVVVAAALATIESEDRQVRIRAYRLLLEYRDQGDLVLPRMRELAQDDRRHVRDMARRFLEDWQGSGDPTESP